ncbi:MAG: hypothetical protein NT030_00565 [Candidatus Saganbacteria bacterium]|nr:hypothetical protein [Candidatus Saganbacteria bacterium]
MAEDSVKQRLDNINAISIAIDTYDDIFSDFDPRDISARDLSEDFIIELMRRHRQNLQGKYDVVLVAPKVIEDQNAEKKIVSRLNKYFHQKHVRYVKRIHEIRIQGLLYIATGMAILLALGLLLNYYKNPDQVALMIIGIIFTPLGWFGIWEGFSKIVDIPFKLANDTTAYKRLSKASYKFEYIVEVKK